VTHRPQPKDRQPRTPSFNCWIGPPKGASDMGLLSRPRSPEFRRLKDCGLPPGSPPRIFFIF
jgi:hypothetical protein